MSNLKYPAIDIVKLISIWDTNDWNAMLTKCTKTKDLNKLLRTRYGMQAGMDIAVKMKIVNSKEQITNFEIDGKKKHASGDRIMLVWLRMMKSLELTAKSIIRGMCPLPDPKINPVEYSKVHKKRTAILKEWMTKSSF